MPQSEAWLVHVHVPRSTAREYPGQLRSLVVVPLGMAFAREVNWPSESDPASEAIVLTSLKMALRSMSGIVACWIYRRCIGHGRGLEIFGSLYRRRGLSQGSFVA